MIGHDVLLSRVFSVLNEYGGEDLLGISTDRVVLDRYIEQAIADAVVALSNAGYSINVKSADPHLSDGRLTLPDDFISLVRLRFADWKKDVHRIYDVSSDEYVWAMNEFTKPGVNNPICFRLNRDTLLCLPKSDDAEEFHYNCTYAKEDGLNGEERAVSAVTYMAAALVMGMFENDNALKRLSDIAMQFLK